VSRNRIADIDVVFGPMLQRHALGGRVDAPARFSMRNCTFLPSPERSPSTIRNGFPASTARPADHRLTGLKFTANGKTLKWRRDLLDGYTFHVEFPRARTSHRDLDYASAVSPEPGYSSSMSATEKLYVVSWNTLLLYPPIRLRQLTYTRACACRGMEVRHVVACCQPGGQRHSLDAGRDCPDVGPERSRRRHCRRRREVPLVTRCSPSVPRLQYRSPMSGHPRARETG